MSIEVLERRVPSTDGIHQLYGKVYVPENEPKGIFQIVHGMSEHIGRYDLFMNQLAEDGWLVIGNNHVGHAYTSEKEDQLNDIYMFNNFFKFGQFFTAILSGRCV